MKRMIHMSDPHVGLVNGEDFGERFRVMLKALIAEKGDKADEYVIVITGDLVDDAANDPAGHEEVKSGLEGLRNAGFGHVLVCPGNHDYGTGSHGDRKLVKRFKAIFYGDRAPYPRNQIIDDVAFIGLDSMAEELHWYDENFAQGELGKEQLGRLNDMLRSDEVVSCAARVVYLHHHPFDWMPAHELKDSRGFMRLLSEIIADGISVDALLYGHNHLGGRHNGRGIPRCYDAGSVTRKGRSRLISWLPWFQVRDATRVIDLEKDPASDYELFR